MKKTIIFLVFISTLAIPQFAKFNFGSPYWVNMNLINQINLGQKYSSLINIIGHPVEVEEIKKNGKETITSYRYRVKENGYNFRRFFKPNLSNVKNHALDDFYNLKFIFNNDILISIERDTDLEVGVEYFNPKKFSASDLLLGVKKPFWLDMQDMNKIKLGMNEKDVVNEIGAPAQFISLHKNGTKDIKRVFYRIREEFSKDLTITPSTYSFPNYNENYILMNDGEKIECAKDEIKLIPYQSFNFIIFKKGGIINFKKGSFTSAGINAMFTDLKGNNNSISKKRISMWVEKGEIKRIGTKYAVVSGIPGDFIFYKDKNDKVEKANYEDIKEIIINGQKMTVIDGEFEAFKVRIWSNNSYNLEFQFDNKVLSHIKRIRIEN